MIFTNFRIFGNFLICFRKFDWKATDVSLYWNLARNPEKIIKHSQKKCKFDEEISRKWKNRKFIFQSRKYVDDFWLKFEIEERCKGVHCVDLGESFPTSIYFQKSASIQPRTSPSKFGGKFNSIFIRLLTEEENGIDTSISTTKDLFGFGNFSTDQDEPRWIGVH